MLKYDDVVADDIFAEFRSFIGNIENYIFENGRSSKEHYEINKLVMELIQKSIDEYKESDSFLEKMLYNFNCGEETLNEAKQLINRLKICSEDIENERGSKNQVDMTLDEYKEALFNEVVYLANRQKNLNIEEQNLVLKSIGVMYSIIAKNFNGQAKVIEQKESSTSTQGSGIEKLRENVRKALEAKNN